jgi:hypothetical protein
MPLLITCSWDEVPHLGAEEKRLLIESIPPHQRKARTTGAPQLGAGAIYPLDEEEVIINDFPIPAFWPRAYGLDVGWNRTATVWGALDRQTNVLYLYSEHYQGRLPPKMHADAIKLRGAWIPGVIDPASTGSSQHDGQRIIDLYRREGLELFEADNSVEAGIYDVWQRLQAGTLKVFRSLVNWRQEYRLYRRKPDGSVFKPKLPADLPEGKSAAQYGDHLCDATRYLCRSGIAVMKCEAPKAVHPQGPFGQFSPPKPGALAWMG